MQRYIAPNLLQPCVYAFVFIHTKRQEAVSVLNACTLVFVLFICFVLEICGKEDVSPRKDCSTLPAATTASPQQTPASLQPTITSPDGTLSMLISAPLSALLY